jgi:thermitase
MNFRTLIIVSLSLFAYSLAHGMPESVPGEFIVKIKPNLKSFSHVSLQNELQSYVKATIPNLNLVVIQRPKIELENSVIKLLEQNSAVEYIEPNYIYRISKTPTDPMFGKLWGLSNVGQSDRGIGTAGIDIDAEKAWDITQGSDQTVVAVIDTGIDYNHPDLKENIWTNQKELNGKPGVDDDGNGYIDDIHGFAFVDKPVPTTNPMDDNGHGTHCAGTIGARGNNGIGVVGVSWNVKMMALKFLGADGSGTLEGAIKAIDYARTNGAKILSNSWGGGGESQALREAILSANSAGALFIAAAGNDGANIDNNPHYPASYDVPNMLAVAAIDNNGRLASFSNYGKRATHVAAPGVNVFSSYIKASAADTGYQTLSGTSMATPHVSGVVALLLSKEPNLTNLQLKERIISSSRKMAALKNRVASGGLVNAFMALTNQISPADPNDPDLWNSKSILVSSAHPYGQDIEEKYDIEIQGAHEIAVYFEKFETEKGYDVVYFYDRSGKLVGSMSGSQDETYSPPIQGDYVRIVFKSDDSVEKNGFDITKAAYR